MAPDDPPLRWLFIDMNSFFAAAEQHLRPELRGRPVGVIPADTRSTCLIAASLTAKAHGLKVGTPVSEALQRCPGLALVVARPPAYVELHHRVAARIDRVAPIERAYSIDEWAVRLRGPQADEARALELARQVHAGLAESFSEALTCSIGIAPTRLLAKIACDLHKPRGLVVLRPADLPGRLAHLAPSDLCGISGGIDSRLERHGVRTVPELWALSRARCREVWGSVEGARWWAGFHGVDEPEAPTRRRSMGHANVLEPRFRTPEGARLMTVRLVHRLGRRLREAGLLAERMALSLLVAGPDGQRFERSAAGTFFPTHSTAGLLEAFGPLWERLGPVAPVTAPHGLHGSQSPWGLTPLRVGVTVLGLSPEAHRTGCLFTQAPQADPDQAHAHAQLQPQPQPGGGRARPRPGDRVDDEARRDRLASAMDAITERWGDRAAYFGGMHGCTHPMDEKIAFGRIPTLRG